MINVIKTKRLEIRAFGTHDFDKISELFSNDNIKKTYMIPDFENKKDWDKLVHCMIELSLSEHRFVRGIYLENELIGLVNDVDIQDGRIELGYVIHPDFWSKGYCTEMLKAVIQELLNRDFTIVKTGAFEENYASIRVMEKCGMRRTDESGTIEYRGMKHNCVYYEINNCQEICFI